MASTAQDTTPTARCAGGHGETWVHVVVDDVEGTARVVGVGVPPRGVARAERVMDAALAGGRVDPASAVAQGLEELWQVQDRQQHRRHDSPAPSAGQRVEAVAAEPTPEPRHFPSSALVRGLAAFLITLTLLLAGGRGALLLRAARMRRRAAVERFREARVRLAERYVDAETGLAPADARPEIDAAAELLLALPSGQHRLSVEELARLAAGCEDAAARLDGAGTDALPKQLAG